jgi:GNAT superfamily N-acetyltransferase
MASIEIRPARPEDREAVLAFCTNTWDWGDYIEYVWDEWLHDPRGQMYVAAVDGKPVAVSRFRMLTPAEAWLEGMRVDPAHRQQGLATAINNVMLAEAKRRGATIARLMTESANTAAIHVIERGSMQRVGAFAPFKAMPVTTPTRNRYGLETPELATSADIGAIIEYLNASNIFPAVGGLYYVAFTAYSITSDIVEAKVEAKQVYLLRRWDRLDGLAFAEPQHGRHGHYLSIGYIDGTTEAISLIAYALRRMIIDMELDSVYASVPDLMMVRDAFVGAEYEWDGKVFYTYEQQLNS